MNGRRMSTRLLALFILLYAVADVSVLQVYCGNEALGIPPDHHMSDLGHDLAQLTDNPCSDADQADCQQVPDDHDYDHRHQCFGWQQVVVAFYSFELGSAAKFTRVHPPVFYQDLHTNSALSHLFRPPRTA